jgi:hypothetical protein
MLGFPVATFLFGVGAIGDLLSQKEPVVWKELGEVVGVMVIMTTLIGFIPVWGWKRVKKAEEKLKFKNYREIKKSRQKLNDQVIIRNNIEE